MGCKNCIGEDKENEIDSSTKNNQTLVKDLEKENEILIPEKENSINNKEISNILKSNSKHLIKIQNENFNLEVLNEINKYRLKHGVEELIEDDNINKISQKYSEKLARESELELSGNKYKGEDLGEIIFCCKSEISPKELVDIWYNEGSNNYNYKKEEANNFTQMIWKNSKSFGIGHTLTKDDKIYVVINFYPQGNVEGQFLKNVFPVKINTEDNSSFYSITTTFLEEALCAHNELRAKHNSPPLILNPTLTTLAQNHSELLAKEGNLNYSNNKLENKKIGENLFMSKMKCTGEEVSLYWYKGIKYYDFQNMNNIENEETKNFTQLIWKSTKEVGFGVTTDKKGNFYVVANYFPCGNIKGQYQYNVLSD
jgi:uncharacterized protein YkwD